MTTAQLPAVRTPSAVQPYTEPTEPPVNAQVRGAPRVSTLLAGTALVGGPVLMNAAVHAGRVELAQGTAGVAGLVLAGAAVQWIREHKR